MPENLRGWDVYNDNFRNIDQLGGVGQQTAQQVPGLLQMAQGVAGGQFGTGPEMESGGGFDPHGPYGANYPTNWQSQPGTFFTWQDRNNQFLDMENRSYASGGKDQAATDFLAKTQRPKYAYMEGAHLPSTDDWRVLPEQYRKPEFALINGRIVNRNLQNPRAYLESLGIGQDDPGHFKMSEGVGIGMPISLNDLSIGGQKGIWPGDVRGRESFTNPSYPTT